MDYAHHNIATLYLFLSEFARPQQVIWLTQKRTSRLDPDFHYFSLSVETKANNSSLMMARQQVCETFVFNPVLKRLTAREF
jgi:hypothetical protein